MQKYDPDLHETCIQILEALLACKTEDQRKRVLQSVSDDPELAEYFANAMTEPPPRSTRR